MQHYRAISSNIFNAYLIFLKKNYKASKKQRLNRTAVKTYFAYN